LLLPALSKAKNKAQRTACLNNGRQIGLGSQLYADEDARLALSGTANVSDDDLNWLFPRYVSNLKTFICPSTKNSIQDQRINIPNAAFEPAPPNETGAPFNAGNAVLYPERVHENTTYVPHLLNNADGRNGLIRHSYEIAGFFNGVNSGGSPLKKRKTQNTIATYTYNLNNTVYPEYNFKGKKASPSDAWIVVESDDPAGGDRPYDDYPDAGDNHGVDGANVIFCDGHAEWVPRKKHLRSFFLGTDENKSVRIPGT
jgi:prepilin-type processing-associated H-X9-DG protein